jgi:4-carboxymuconolactone decarboxylase
MPRISPLSPKEWPKEFRTALAALRPPNAKYAPLPTEDRPKGRNVLGTWAHHPELAQAYFTLNGHVLMTTTLSERQRELIVLRVAAVRKSGYEWAQHVFVGRDVGLTDEEIGRIAYGPDAPFWSALDAAMLRAVDELIEVGGISASTWETLTAELDVKQVLDLICTVGTYETLARIFASLEVDIDDDINELMGRYDELF